MPPVLKHVFISHSHADNAIGQRLCDILELRGIKCWYSSRHSDLEPGGEWDDNIVGALDRSIAVVLLFSAASNKSIWVKRELLMAGRRDLPIYPLRLENVSPTGGMEAHLASVQWTDAFPGPLERYLNAIIARLLPHFAAPDTGVPEPLPSMYPGVLRRLPERPALQPAAQWTAQADPRPLPVAQPVPSPRDRELQRAVDERDSARRTSDSAATVVVVISLMLLIMALLAIVVRVVASTT